MAGPLEALIPLGYAGLFFYLMSRALAQAPARAAARSVSGRELESPDVIGRRGAATDGDRASNMERERAFRLIAFAVTMRPCAPPSTRPLTICWSWRTAFRRRRRTSSPRRSSSRRRTRSTGRERATPGPVSVVPPPHLRGVVGLDDGQRVARPGVARRVPAGGASDVDRRRLRRAAPPDGTARARLNPFASPESARRPSISATTTDRCRARDRSSTASARAVTCRATTWTTCRSTTSPPIGPSGLEHARLAADFNPTSDAGTGIAFAHVRASSSATRSRGRAGVFCAICHSIAATRDTPYHTFARAVAPRAPEYVPARGTASRAQLRAGAAGHLRRARSERAEPRVWHRRRQLSSLAARHRFPRSVRSAHRDTRTGARNDVSRRASSGRRCRTSRWTRASSTGYHDVLLTRSELCAGCHDVTNPLTIENRLGKWVGGFPDRAHLHRMARQPLRRSARQPELRSRTTSATARPVTCSRTTASRERRRASITAAARSRRCEARSPTTGRERPYFSHHFVGGNSYIPRLIGASMDALGAAGAYPKLSIFSFTSADEQQPVSQRLLDRHGQPRARWCSRRASRGIGCATCSISDVTGPRHRRSGIAGATDDSRDQQRQRTQVPDRLSRRTRRVGRGACVRSRLRARAGDPRRRVEHGPRAASAG